MSAELLPLSDEKVKLRLNSISELSKNARTVLLIVTFISAYVFNAIMSIQYLDSIDNATDNVLKTYQYMEDSDEFFEALDSIDLPRWDWLTRLTIRWGLYGIAPRRVEVRHLLTTVRSISITILEKKYNYEESTDCEPHTSQDELGKRLCDFLIAIKTLEDAARMEADFSIYIDAYPLKGEFKAENFLLMSSIAIFIFYSYLIFLSYEIIKRIDALEDDVGIDSAKLSVYPWLLSFARYGHTEQKIFSTIAIHFPSLFVLTYSFILQSYRLNIIPIEIGFYIQLDFGINDGIQIILILISAILGHRLVTRNELIKTGGDDRKYGKLCYRAILVICTTFVLINQMIGA